MFWRLVIEWRRVWAKEEGISTLEWIGLTAVVLVFITAALYYAQEIGWPQLMGTVADRFRSQIRGWSNCPPCW